jgi:imidazolonepropionase-like amidohydrolase
VTTFRRRILRGAGVGAALLVGLGAAVVLALRPPASLAVPPQGAVLADVTVVDPGHGRRAHQTIRVAGSVIASISREPAARDDPAEPRRHRGGYVLPGLIDLHVHHPPGALATDVKAFDLLHLAYGVTTTRDCGSIDGTILEIRAEVAGGAFAGPRIFACGPLIDGDPAFWPGAAVARDAAEGERIVDRVAATGVDCVKVYSNLSPDALRGVRAAASRHHLMLVGHVPLAVPLEEAHLDDVQHLTGVPGMPAGDATRGLIPALLAGWDTIDDARIDAVVRASLAHEIAYTPTIVVMKRVIGLGDYATLLADPAAQLLPRYYRELLWKPGAMAGWSLPALPPEKGQRILHNFRKVVRRLHEAAVVLHVGTDTFNPFVVPGVSMNEELGEFVASGFTPEEAWEAATRGNGASLSVPGLGVIEPGAPADLLVFGEDPTRDLAALSTLEVVVANGRYYRKEQLDEAVARYRDYFGSWLFDRVTMWVFPWFLRQSG